VLIFFPLISLVTESIREKKGDKKFEEQKGCGRWGWLELLWEILRIIQDFCSDLKLFDLIFGTVAVPKGL